MKYLLVGILGGIVGGMGMGGGTLLIPMLTLMLDVGQKSAQLINIMSFIPMGILTLIINARRGLISWRYIIYVSISGTIGAIIGSLFVDSFDASILRIAFGIFLMVLGLYFIISTIVGIVKKKRAETLVSINVTKHDDED